MPEVGGGITIQGVSFYKTGVNKERIALDRNVLPMERAGEVETQRKTISSDPKHPTLVAVGSVCAAIYLVGTYRNGILVSTKKPDLKTAESEDTYPSGPTLFWGCNIYTVYGDGNDPKERKPLTKNESGCVFLQFGIEYEFKIPVSEP